MEVYENRVDGLSKNLEINEIFILVFFQFYCKINRKQLEIVVEVTSDLRVNKYFAIKNVKFGGSGLVPRCFEFHSISRGAAEIGDQLISKYFGTQNYGLFVIISLSLN